MRIEIPHNTTRQNARSILETRMAELENQYGSHASDVDKQWDGDRLHFSFKAKGFTGKGTVEVTDREIIVDGKLPLIAKPFEPRIRSTVEREAASMFPSA